MPQFNVAMEDKYLWTKEVSHREIDSSRSMCRFFLEYVTAEEVEYAKECSISNLYLLA